MADAIVINKANTAPPGAVDALRAVAAALNPSARVYATDSTITVDAPEVLVVVLWCWWWCCCAGAGVAAAAFSPALQVQISNPPD